MYNAYIVEMGLSIHRVAVFVGVIVYRTWMLLWEQVIVFVGLLYSIGGCALEFIYRACTPHI